MHERDDSRLETSLQISEFGLQNSEDFSKSSGRSAGLPVFRDGLVRC